MYAVFRTGGKQYRASQGDRIRIEKLDVEEGADVSFEDVLLVGEGTDVTVGTPVIGNTVVTAKVVQQGKTRKVPVVKFKRRQNYLRQGSHRQFFTEVEIVSIGGAKAKKAKSTSDTADKPAAEKASKKKVAKKASGTKKTAKKKTTKKAAKKKSAAKDGDQ